MGTSDAKFRSGTVPLNDEDGVKEILANAILELWDVVNNLTRLKPSRRDRYRVTIFGSARARPGSFAYEETKRVAASLAELGCDQKDQILLLNKADRVSDPAVLLGLQGKYPHANVISAVTGAGADKLVANVIARIKGRRVALTLTADFRNGKLMQYIAQHAEVADRQWGEDRKSVV